MELYDLIPNGNDKNWVVNGKYLMYKKYFNIPVCYIDNGVVYIFLDIKIKKIILKFIKHLIKLGLEFYFTTPLLSNPKGLTNPKHEIIKHYLVSYSNKELYYDFKKIDFDLIQNMTKWTEKENCFHLVKDIFDNRLKSVMSCYYDWNSNKAIYNYPEEIRNDFQSLYRDIKINKLLN